MPATHPQSVPPLLKWVAIPLGCLILLSFFIMKGVHAYDAVKLMQSRSKVKAEVTTGGMPREDSHYRFTVGSQDYHGRGPRRLQEGETLIVAYDPANPKRNRPADGLWGDVTLFGVVVVAMFGGGIWVWSDSRKRLRQRATVVDV